MWAHIAPINEINRDKFVGVLNEVRNRLVMVGSEVVETPIAVPKTAAFPLGQLPVWKIKPQSCVFDYT